MNMNKQPDETLKQGRNRSWLLVKFEKRSNVPMRFHPTPPVPTCSVFADPPLSTPLPFSWTAFMDGPYVFFIKWGNEHSLLVIVLNIDKLRFCTLWYTILTKRKCTCTLWYYEQSVQKHFVSDFYCEPRYRLLISLLDTLSCYPPLPRLPVHNVVALFSIHF